MQRAADEFIRVVLVAPPIMGWALQELLKSSPRIRVVHTGSELQAARELAAAQSVDVVVLDSEGAVDRTEMVEFIAQRIVRVIVITAVEDVGALDNAVLNGLQGIVRKSESPGVLLNAIEKVHEGQLWLDRSATSRMFMQLVRQKAADKNDPEHAKIALLTQRERQAIAALASDTAAPAKVIASRLCISEHTLRNHLTSIYSKLHLANRLDLYAYATRNQLDRLPG